MEKIIHALDVAREKAADAMMSGVAEMLAATIRQLRQEAALSRHPDRPMAASEAVARHARAWETGEDHQ